MEFDFARNRPHQLVRPPAPFQTVDPSAFSQLFAFLDPENVCFLVSSNVNSCEPSFRQG